MHVKLTYIAVYLLLKWFNIYILPNWWCNELRTSNPHFWSLHRLRLIASFRKKNTRPTLEHRATLGRLRFMKILKTIFWCWKKGNNWKWCNLKLNWNRKSISIIERVIYRDMCRVICITFQRSFPLYIEIYRMGKNKRTVNTSTTPHISDQSGTEKAFKTPLCWFIIII